MTVVCKYFSFCTHKHTLQTCKHTNLSLKALTMTHSNDVIELGRHESSSPLWTIEFMFDC